LVVPKTFLTFVKPIKTQAMNAFEIASAVKDYLVNLAEEDRLPLDLTELDTSELEEVIQGLLPTEQDEAVERASHYLCDGDLSILEQVEAIANHEDQDDLIDNVDGVVVWEKVEYSYTCDKFLSDIGW
jgi:antitoxin component of RelBE/YafQ-DinJ toxin-antitoxin module